MRYHTRNRDDHEYEHEFCAPNACIRWPDTACYDDQCQRPHVHVLTDAEFQALQSAYVSQQLRYIDGPVTKAQPVRINSDPAGVVIENCTFNGGSE